MITETNLPCRIDYRGNGVLVVQKPPPGAPGQYDPTGAHFQLVKLKGDRMGTEYVPGFAGLNFDAAAWRAFIAGPQAAVEFKWPSWTCDDYEKWRAEHQGAVFDEQCEGV